MIFVLRFFYSEWKIIRVLYCFFYVIKYFEMYIIEGVGIWVSFFLCIFLFVKIKIKKVLFEEC